MTKERYESLALQNLKEIAKNRGMKKISTLKKAELIEALLKKDEEDALLLAAQNGGRIPKTEQKKPDAPIIHKNEFASELDSGQLANGILPVNLTAASWRTESLKSCLTATDLSDARIIFREIMIYMWLPVRSEGSTSRRATS